MLFRSGVIAERLLAAGAGSLPSLTDLACHPTSDPRAVRELFRRPRAGLASLELLPRCQQLFGLSNDGIRIGLPNDLAGVTRLAATSSAISEPSGSWLSSWTRGRRPPSSLARLEVEVDSVRCLGAALRGLRSLTSLELSFPPRFDFVLVSAGSGRALEEALRPLRSLAELEARGSAASLQLVLRAAGAAAGPRIRRVLLTHVLDGSGKGAAATEELARECARTFPSARTEVRAIAA